MKSYRRLKFACYSGNTSMSVVGNLSPLLFLTFRELYGISYSLLGLLVLINFCTQLGIDLIFSFFSHKFNIQKTVRLMPILTVIGLFIFALWPFFFPQTAYAGLVVGTVLFSISSGLGEVLISPIIAAIPAEDPDREMSKLHSIYAWGVVGVVLFSTLFLLLFGKESWHWLTLLLALIPITSAILYAGSEIPPMETPEKTSGALHLLKNTGLWLCVFAIFLGGAAECTMAQWCSGYLEQALGIPKVWGDIFGVALFAVMLGTGRTLYAKIGKNITKVLLACAIGSTLCYLTAAISPLPVIGLFACALTGLCTSMLWPGALIFMEENIPAAGVTAYALMAAGGDMGAGLSPQLLGMVVDRVAATPMAGELGTALGISAEQVGLKAGMLVIAVFPILGIAVLGATMRYFKKNKQ